MSWFGEQILERIRKDRKLTSDVLSDIDGILRPGRKGREEREPDKSEIREEILAICRYYRAPVPEKPCPKDDINDQIDYMMSPSGILKRRVQLTGDWWKSSVCPLLAVTKKGVVTALLPGRRNGYVRTDPVTGEKTRITAAEAGEFEEKAYCFYRPMPQSSMTTGDLLLYMARALNAADWFLVILAAFAVMAFGMLTPMLTNILFTVVIPSGEKLLLATAAVLLACAAFSAWLLNAVKGTLKARIDTKIDVAMSNGTMGRILNMPTVFFRQYGPGELAERTTLLTQVGALLSEMVFGAGLTTFFSLGYLIEIRLLAPGLAGAAALTVVAELAVIVLYTVLKTKYVRKKLLAKTKVNGIVYSLFSGIQKIRLSGSENRAFAKWAKAYTEEAREEFDRPALFYAQDQLISVITLVGMAAVYFISFSRVTTAQYMVFSTAFGMVTASVLALSALTDDFVQFVPILDLARPILTTVPENDAAKKQIDGLSGQVELNHISFRYAEDGPLILDDISLSIRPGQYVAIVGASGCGKSTLLRLMLGFETPEKGSVYYDGTDMSEMNLRSLRRNIGTVLQEGQLFNGDIYSNITISAPWLSMSDAWEAAEMAGIADDIRKMPMQMYTYISEGGGGISGGQRQRIMIARAIAAKPKILMMDEATSALDNITQKTVSDSLEALKCTRIVIAHRLSTIRNCDRILVLDKGRIAEEGTYQELIEKDGVFAELVRRQRLDVSV